MKSIKAIWMGIAVVLVLLSSGCASMGSEVRIPMESEGEKYTLSATLHLPEGKKGPFPVVILSHGSEVPRLPVWPYGQPPTDIFLKQGFAVLLPMRSGHGSSGGKNHEPNCHAPTNLSGITHAGTDLHAAVEYVKANPNLDASRIILGGHSRGGILSVIYAARAKNVSIKGVINFAGTWTGCFPNFNEAVYKNAGVGYKTPNLWIFSMGDSFTSDRNIKLYLSNFKEGGGVVDFKYYNDSAGGHFIVAQPSAWEADVREFLKRLGF